MYSIIVLYLRIELPNIANEKLTFLVNDFSVSTFYSRINILYDF